MSRLWQCETVAKSWSVENFQHTVELQQIKLSVSMLMVQKIPLSLAIDLMILFGIWQCKVVVKS
jgi:hypothetical protein